MAYIENKGGGRWKIQFSAGSENGERKRLTKTFTVDPVKSDNAQRREIEKMANAYETDLQRGLLSASHRITLKQLADEWFDSYVKRRKLAPNTQAHYKHLLEGRILPCIGAHNVQDMTSKQINSFITWVENDAPLSAKARGNKLSGTTCKKYHTLLHSLFEFAIRQGYITVNPVASTIAPENDTPKKTIYNSDQSAHLLKALDSEPIKWRAYFHLALLSQMRRSELITLTWEDVDLDRRIVFVSKSAYYAPGEGSRLKAPKSASGHSQIIIPQNVCTLLEEHRREQNIQRLKLGTDWQNIGAVFTQWDGRRLHLDSPANRLKEIINQNNLPPLSPHGLRHTGASLLIASGEDYKTVQHRLGHSRTSTTLDIYAHHLDHRDAEASAVLDTLLTAARKRAN
jgi:integrase